MKHRLILTEVAIKSDIVEGIWRAFLYLIMIGTKVKGKKTATMVFSRKIITFML